MTKSSPPLSSLAPQSVLNDVFGISEFRHDQKPAIERTLKGQHSLVIMPTGSGKSLCYQIPARILYLSEKGLTVVVSPLVALMRDQVENLKKLGFRAAFINSSLTRDQRETAYKRLFRKEFEILYVTPERFRKSEFWEALKPNQVALLAVDEAHSISEWGHDFRPDYTRLKDVRERLGLPTTLALTATATTDVQQDILKELGLNDRDKDSDSDVQIFSSGMERPNLSLSMIDLYGIESKVRAVVGLRHQNPGPGIVYFSLISTLSEFSEMLRALSIEHRTYHGQMNREGRSRAQDWFQKESSPLILATPAFGLGIDKPDVRWIAHAEIPGSLEAYYQEIGRAGRDSKPSNCVLLYDSDDVTIQTDFLKWAHPEPSFIKNVYELIFNNPERWSQEGADFIRAEMHFHHRRDFRTETAINLLERWGCLEGDLASLDLKPVSPPPKELLDPERHQDRKIMAQKKLLKMVQFATSTSCRPQQIYQYFGRDGVTPCGVCDNCLKTSTSETEAGM